MALPPSLTTVTPISKFLAMLLFITLPFAGFYLGMQYGKISTTSTIYLAKNKGLAIQPPISPTLSSIPSSWKTFTNTQFHYSFRYPEDYIVGTSHDPMGVYETTITNVASGDFASGKRNVEDKDVFNMVIVNPYSTDTTLSQIKETHKLQNVQPYTIDGEPAIIIPSPLVVSVIMAHNQKEYSFNLGSGNSIYKDYFYQILSTLKFTD